MITNFEILFYFFISSYSYYTFFNDNQSDEFPLKKKKQQQYFARQRILKWMNNSLPDIWQPNNYKLNKWIFKILQMMTKYKLDKI